MQTFGLKGVLVACGIFLAGLGWADETVAPPASVDAAAKPRPKIALVLSGGGARGLAHIGVLKELQRLRVPYDCIVGTSMGAIAGGAFATGIPVDEAERRVVNADWKTIFADKSKRSDIPYFRKEDDWKDYFDFTLILKDLRLHTPRNVLGVQNIGLFFRELTGAQYSSNFDNLPVPYRAMGTDIVTGEPVVINDGTVATAMRASMTVPGVFPPIEYKGHLLVDGGIAKNIPVDVGRQLCGDVVIVVNVSTPTFKEEQLDSFYNIGQQVISIAMQHNMDEQLKLVTANDVLITPDFGDYTAADFQAAKALIDIGEKAAQKADPQLQRYAVSEQEYAAWRAHIDARKQPPPLIRRVTVERTHWVSPDVMQNLLDVRLGEPLDQERLHHNIDKVYSRGDFTSISYDVLPLGNGDGEVILKPVEKPGRDFVRFGLKLESDSNNSSDFGLLASLRRVWLNRLDAEWTSDLEIGSNQRLYTELYQPAATDGKFFVAPYANYENVFHNVVVNNIAISEYQVRKYGAGLEMGSTIGAFGQVRGGVYKGRASFDPTLGLPLGNGSEDRSGYTLRGIYDQLDNPRFPHEGGAVHLDAFFADTGLGAPESWKRLDLDARKAFTFDRNIVLLDAHFGHALGSNLPFYELFHLGGLFNLSSYRPWSLFGNNLVYGRAQFSRELLTLPSVVGQGLYGGVMLEAGNILNNDQMRQFNLSDMNYSGGIYFAADTRLGPFYLALARGSNDKLAGYLALGVTF